MTLEEIQESLRDKNLSDIAKQVRVTRSYIHAIAKGKRINPSYEMIKRLSQVLGADKA